VLSTAAAVNGVANRVVRGLSEDEAALSRVTVALMQELYEEARAPEGDTDGDQAHAPSWR